MLSENHSQIECFLLVALTEAGKAAGSPGSIAAAPAAYLTTLRAG